MAVRKTRVYSGLLPNLIRDVYKWNVYKKQIRLYRELIDEAYISKPTGM